MGGKGKNGKRGENGIRRGELVKGEEENCKWRGENSKVTKLVNEEEQYSNRVRKVWKKGEE